MDTRTLSSIASKYSTPTYVFDLDNFKCRNELVHSYFPKVGLCYSIKANPFLLADASDYFANFEVCSPGELTICERSSIDMKKIIYSGVNKGAKDVARAIADDVGIITAESRQHYELIVEAASKAEKCVNVILRLSDGSQFGMDAKILEDILIKRGNNKYINIIGLHYFTGTQKKSVKKLAKELNFLDNYCMHLKEDFNYIPDRIEYGTGLFVDYFNTDNAANDEALLSEASTYINDFADKYPLTIEMGRFFAASCGNYLTSVADVKCNKDNNYAICDGGINQLKYHGQTMAMQIPPLAVLNNTNPDTTYTLCGSLCSTADILVAQVKLPKLAIGDVLAFGYCGAYSVMEGISIFLSRKLPRVILYSKEKGAVLVRDFFDTSTLNSPFMGGVED